MMRGARHSPPTQGHGPNLIHHLRDERKEARPTASGEELMSWWKSLFGGSPNVAPPAPRRLDGRSRVLLGASIKMLPYDEPGWITSKEAKSLFSPMGDQYAFGEMDEVGKQNLSSFASGMGDGCLFEFMPVEDRVYFIRKSSGPG
jgi:hypothetical protein